MEINTFNSLLSYYSEEEFVPKDQTGTATNEKQKFYYQLPLQKFMSQKKDTKDWKKKS